MRGVIHIEPNQNVDSNFLGSSRLIVCIVLALIAVNIGYFFKQDKETNEKINDLLGDLMKTVDERLKERKTTKSIFVKLIEWSRR